ncbi:MAG: hypothetical protein B7Y70_12545 [Rhizobiales bacterium 35-68-8]|nr:MAG: hypothetical protein B7Y70_12545 [Rhizobiales bacterium 35-68-8]
MGATKGSAKPELLAFIDAISAQIDQGHYADAASAIADFKKGHHGLGYFIEEALPSRVTDHLLKVTGAHTAFTTFTLRRPNWTTELNAVSSDPEGFASFIARMEADIREIAASKAPKAA